MNTRRIRTHISCVIPLLSEMSDLILNLPHIDISIYVVQIIDTPHNFRSYESFIGFAFYKAVRCDFDKHLYLIRCLNAHNHNTCTRLPQTGCTAQKWHYHY